MGLECVNLPRWGLKQGRAMSENIVKKGVNLPRWGLKQKTINPTNDKSIKCKFTPLGFETCKL